MDRTLLFYSQPSRMSAYPIYHKGGSLFVNRVRLDRKQELQCATCLPTLTSGLHTSRKSKQMNEKA